MLSSLQGWMLLLLIGTAVLAITGDVCAEHVFAKQPKLQYWAHLLAVSLLVLVAACVTAYSASGVLRELLEVRRNLC